MTRASSRQAFLSASDSTRRTMLQLLLVALLGSAVVGFLVFRPDVADSALLWTGSAILVLATFAAVAVPWESLPRRVEAVVPVADLVAIGCIRLATQPEGSTLSLLMFLPATWLLLFHRSTGVLLAVLGILLTVTVPTLVRAPRIDPVSVASNLLLPLVVLMVSVMILTLRRELELAQRREEKLSAQVAAERDQARRAARLLESVGDTLNVGVLVMDADGNDLMYNQTQRLVHELVSPQSNEDRTEAGHLIYHSDRRTPLRRELRPAYRASRGETFDNLLVWAGPPGPDQRALSVTARTLRNEKGVREGSVLVMYDVTEMREAMRVREEFVAKVSHELRTPLTSILGYLELAEDELEEGAPDQRVLLDYLQVAVRNSQQLSSLVEDLLVEQQVRAGRLRLNLERQRISTLAARAVRSSVPAAAAQGVRLVDRCEQTPETMVDSRRILQIFDNLISNAVKFTPAGGTVTVQTLTRTDEVELVVSDDGPGMAAEDASRLFTPFFRARSSGAADAPGVGLGLAIVQSISEAHGGHASVETAPGAGSTFRVTLPATDPSREDLDDQRR